MRPLILISAVVWAGCAAETEPQPPPTDRFVYPSGIVHRQVPGSASGALYVASANFDKCFDTGAVLALDLDKLQGSMEGQLPPFGELGASVPPREIVDLQVAPESAVQIESFAGQIALWDPPAGGTPRLFVPTRAEENYLHAIDIDSQDKTKLVCANGADRNCIPGALSLTSNIAESQDDLPRAPAPIGVTVAGRDGQPELWVTHLEAADSPARTARNPHTYVVRIPQAAAPELSLSAGNFISLTSGGLPLGGAHSTAVGDRYVYVTGRSYVAADQTQPASFLLRLIDRTDTSRILETGLSSVYRTLEARNIQRVALGMDTDRLYILARAPDTLLVVDVEEASSARPRFLVRSAVSLPDGASDLAVMPRLDGNGLPLAGQELVAVTCTATTRTKGVVAFYDAKLDQIVGQVGNVGTQPYGIAVDHRGSAARLFVTNFGDGRVAVIDIPDFEQMERAHLVAYLGRLQERDEKQGTSTCQ